MSASGEYLVLIGAFSNEANVKNLRAKLAEQGIRTFSEPLDTPQGNKKTRVRVGLFASREADEKALEKMQRIGVSWGYCGEAMTVFDYVVIGIVSLSLLFGLWRGVIGEGYCFDCLDGRHCGSH